MGLVQVHVTLRNAREAVLARLGRLDPAQVHRYETEALVDTGAFRSVIPPLVAERLGLVQMSQTTARMANGAFQMAPVMEPVFVEILEREAVESPLVFGDRVLLSVLVLEQTDLLVDCQRQRVIPNPEHPDQPVFRI